MTDRLTGRGRESFWILKASLKNTQGEKEAIYTVRVKRQFYLHCPKHCHRSINIRQPWFEMIQT